MFARLMSQFPRIARFSHLALVGGQPSVVIPISCRGNYGDAADKAPSATSPIRTWQRMALFGADGPQSHCKRTQVGTRLPNWQNAIAQIPVGSDVSGIAG